MAVLLAAVFALERINSSSQRLFVEDAIPLTGHVHDLVLQMVNQETAVRGYLLTGDPASLEPYASGRVAAEADLNAIEPFLAEHPELTRLIARARLQIAAVEEYFERQIALVSAGSDGREEAQRRVLVGQRLFAAFRQSAGAMLADTDSFVMDAQDDQNRVFREFLVLLLVLGGAALGIGAVLFVRTPRRVQALYGAEQEARRAAERASERVGFLAEASELLGSSLEYERTLARLVALAVPRLADWCWIDLLRADGSLERLGDAHRDLVEQARPARLAEPDVSDQSVARILRTGEPELVSDSAVQGGDQPLRELGARSWVAVPMIARGRRLGVLTLASAGSGRRHTVEDLELAQELARRAAAAVDNARLFRVADRGAQAARALAYVADAVVLLDGDGVVRYWNPAAETLTGVPEAEALGRAAAEVVPGVESAAVRALDEREERSPSPAVTLPISLEGQERWLSISGVRFGEGTVYALRDVTEERALEQARSDFVATVSHELRTPLAAVYGAARTLRRDDIELTTAETASFLEMIETESDRLSRIVGQILLVGQLEQGDVGLRPEPCDLVALSESVLASADVHRPEGISLRLSAQDDLPTVRCDSAKLRQVLVNLVENAIKYSPDGGEVAILLSSENGTARVEVRDSGLGIPAADQERIFEKFARLDPGLDRGVGGTGLGLYVVRELVERMEGRIDVRSAAGEGSTFAVELPLEPAP